MSSRLGELADAGASELLHRQAELYFELPIDSTAIELAVARTRARWPR